MNFHLINFLIFCIIKPWMHHAQILVVHLPLEGVNNPKEISTPFHRVKNIVFNFFLKILSYSVNCASLRLSYFFFFVVECSTLMHFLVVIHNDQPCSKYVTLGLMQT
jgi:hypothetical protein